MRWAFARFYREFAWTYDTVAAAVSGGSWFAWGRAALPYITGPTLELGCGTGHLQQELARRPDFNGSIGLDASPQMLAITRRRSANHDIPLRLVRAFAQALPFSAGSFATVVATFPSDYIVDPATLAEVRRVLRPAGRLVIVLAASFGADSLYYRAVGLLYRATLQRSPGQPPLRQLRSAAANRLAESGFSVDERWDSVAGGYVHLIIATL